MNSGRDTAHPMSCCAPALWMRAAAALLAVLLAAVVVCLGNTMNSMGRISAALEGVGSGRCGRAGLEARYGRRKPRHQHTGRQNQPDGRTGVQRRRRQIERRSGCSAKRFGRCKKLGRRRLPAAWRACSASRSSAKTKNRRRPLFVAAPVLVFFSPPVRPDRLLHIWRPQRRPPPL